MSSLCRELDLGVVGTLADQLGASRLLLLIPSFCLASSRWNPLQMLSQVAPLFRLRQSPKYINKMLAQSISLQGAVLAFLEEQAFPNGKSYLLKNKSFLNLTIPQLLGRD